LRIGGFVEGRRLAGCRPDDRTNRPTKRQIERFGTTIKCFAESRRGIVELSRHPSVLRTLTGEKESDTGHLWGSLALNEVWMRPAVIESHKRFRELASGGARHGETMSEVRTARIRREARVREGRPFGLSDFKILRILLREFPEGTIVARRHHHHLGRAIGMCALAMLNGRRLFHNDVSVRATEPE
jgi:hypothetical protein